MTIWMEPDCEGVWSSFGDALEHHPALLRAILHALPQAQGPGDGVDRVLAIYRWLHFSQCQSVQLHRGWQRDWAVSMQTHVNLVGTHVHCQGREVESSQGGQRMDGAWVQLSEPQAVQAMRKARPRGVARWMHLLHAAEQQAAAGREEMLLVKIYPRQDRAAVPSMVLLTLGEYLQEAVERRRQQPFTTFHLPCEQSVARVRARQLEAGTETAIGSGAPRRL